ncbi:MAG: fibronectin type III domain-containing protein, partial [Bacteroidales bacterium]|nr:fibronectin type III domain-containing protein [Bacteroidales bacterium]
TFTANQATNQTINIDVPAAQVQSNWTETDNTVASYIQNKPNLANVATTGSYNDLSDQPTINDATLTIKQGENTLGTFTANAGTDATITVPTPAEQVQANWNEDDNTSAAYIQNKPTLATVATSGNYSDLSNKPAINDATLTIQKNGTDVGTFTANQSTASTINIEVPAQVNANWTEDDNTSAAYIQNKPTIPTVNNATITVVQGGVTLGTFTVNTDENTTIEVPTPAEQVQANWTELDATSEAFIQNKPTLAPVAINGDYNFLTNTPDLTEYVTKAGSNAISAENTFSGTNAFSSTVTVPQAVNQTTLAYTNDEMQAVSYKDLMFVFDSLSSRIAALQNALEEQQNLIENLQDTMDAIHDNAVPEFMGMTFSSTCEELTATATFNSPASDITGYEFAISTNSDMSGATTQTTTEATYTFTGLTAGTTYYVTATATNANGPGTSPIQTQSSIGLPSFTINVTTYCSTEIDVEASIPSSTSCCVPNTNYTVYLANDRQMTDIVESNTTSDYTYFNPSTGTYYVAATLETNLGTVYSDTVEVVLSSVWSIQGFDTVKTCSSITIKPQITGAYSESGWHSGYINISGNGVDDYRDINTPTDSVTFTNLIPGTTYNVYYYFESDCNWYNTDFHVTTGAVSSAAIYDSLSLVAGCGTVTVTPHFTTSETDYQYHYILYDYDWIQSEVTNSNTSHTFSDLYSGDDYKVQVQIVLPDGCGTSSPRRQVVPPTLSIEELSVSTEGCGNITVTPNVTGCGGIDGRYYWYLSDSEHHPLQNYSADACCEESSFEHSYTYHSLAAGATYFVKYKVEDYYYSGTTVEDSIEVTIPDYESSVTYNSIATSWDCGTLTVTPNFTASVPVQYKYTLYYKYHWDEEMYTQSTVTNTETTWTFTDVTDPWDEMEYYVLVEAIPSDATCTASSPLTQITIPSSSVTVTYTTSAVTTTDAIILTVTFSDPVSIDYTYFYEYTNWSEANMVMDATGTVGTVAFTGLNSGETYTISGDMEVCGRYIWFGESQYTTLTDAGTPVYITHQATSSTSGESLNLSSNFSANGSEITEYTFMVGTTDAREDAELVDGLTTNTGTFAPTTPNTTYYVWATATNANGTTVSDSIIVTTLGGEPVYTDHTISSSNTGTLMTSTATFDQGGSEITNYTFYVGTTAVRAEATEVDNGSNATLTYTTEPNTTYYVWVDATNAIGSTSSPTYKSITTPGTPLFTSLAIDSTNASGALLKATASFNNNRSTITDYTFYVGTTDVFDDAVAESNGADNIYNYTAVPGTRYYVWVEATNGVGTTVINVYKTGTMKDYATVSTLSATLTSASTANITGEVIADGGANITERGFCWSHSATPTIDNTHQSVSGTLGDFSMEMSGLALGSIYHVRAYATNSVGTAYGDEFQFQVGTGTPPTPTIPSVTTTLEERAHYYGFANLSGEIVSDGGDDITERGFCYSTSPNPTITDNIKTSVSTSHFAERLNDLSTSTTYYVRAYATNSIGTAYGQEVSFTTDEFACNGNITDHEGNTYTTVLLGTQCWMAENMRCMTSPTTGYNFMRREGDDRTGVSKIAYYINNDPSYVEQGYGILYNWCAAVDTFRTTEQIDNDDNWTAFAPALEPVRQGICPEGWHIPNNTETQALVSYVNANYANPRNAMASTFGWNGTQGTNETGFNAIPAGGAYSYQAHLGEIAHFWTVTQNGTNYAKLMTVTKTSLNGNAGDGHKWYGRSVRCISDAIFE